MRTVMVFGTFDILHEGHRFMFREAKKLGDRLVVVVGRDSTVERIKGKKPRNSHAGRLPAVYNEQDVDEAVLGYEDDYFRIIEEKKPDVICLGYDQKSMMTDRLEQELKKKGIKAEIVRLKPYREEIYKSSKMNLFLMLSL